MQNKGSGNIFFFVFLTLTLQYVTSQNGQTHFKNLAAFAARILKHI